MMILVIIIFDYTKSMRGILFRYIKIKERIVFYQDIHKLLYQTFNPVILLEILMSYVNLELKRGFGEL